MGPLQDHPTTPHPSCHNLDLTTHRTFGRGRTPWPNGPTEYHGDTEDTYPSTTEGIGHPSTLHLSPLMYEKDLLKRPQS